MGELGLEVTMEYGAVGDERGAQARAAFSDDLRVLLQDEGIPSTPEIGARAKRTARDNMMNGRKGTMSMTIQQR